MIARDWLEPMTVEKELFHRQRLHIRKLVIQHHSLKCDGEENRKEAMCALYKAEDRKPNKQFVFIMLCSFVLHGRQKLFYGVSQLNMKEKISQLFQKMFISSILDYCYNM